MTPAVWTDTDVEIVPPTMYEAWGDEVAVEYVTDRLGNEHADDSGRFTQKGTGSGGRTVIGKGSTGEVSRAGDDVFKPATRSEGEVYRTLAGVPGVAAGREEGGEIVTPFFPHVLSVDTVPDKNRRSYAPVVVKNLPRIVNAVTALSQAGFEYNDPIQLGFDANKQAHLFDFSAAQKTDPANAVRENLTRVADYLDQFGAGRQAGAFRQVAGVWDYVNNEDARAFDSDSDDGRDAERIVSRLAGPPVGAYYTFNAREIPGVPQTEPRNGMKVIVTDKPLTEEFMRQWEISPAVHRTAGTGYSRPAPYVTDSGGREHKEAGPGGGQFTSKGGSGGEGVVSDPAAPVPPPGGESSQKAGDTPVSLFAPGSPGAVVVSRLPEAARTRLASRLTKVTEHPTVGACTAAWYAGEPVPVPAARQVPCVGFYDPGTGELHASLGNVNVDAGGTIAHEIGHALDQSDDRQYFDLSDTPEFRAVWAAEMKGGKLSNYARTDEQEGFAEFCRLLYGTPGGDALARQHFPQSYAYFQRAGLVAPAASYRRWSPLWYDTAVRREGEVWQGPSRRWFTLKNGRVVPTKAPGAQDPEKREPGQEDQSQSGDAQTPDGVTLPSNPVGPGQQPNVSGHGADPSGPPPGQQPHQPPTVGEVAGTMPVPVPPTGPEPPKPLPRPDPGDWTVPDWQHSPGPRGSERRWRNRETGAVYYGEKPPKGRSLEERKRAAEEREKRLSQRSDLSYSPDTAKYAGEMRDELGLWAEDIAGLTGSMPGSVVSVGRSPWSGAFTFNVDHPDVQHWTRNLSVGGDGSLNLYNAVFFLKPKAQGGGFGTAAFANQIAGCVAAGVDTVSTCAGKGGSGADAMNGYYTWPCLGYDAPLSDNVRRRLPPELKWAGTVQDLYTTKEGKEWWKKHGEMCSMEFDVRPGSTSMKVLNAYLEKKGLPTIDYPAEKYAENQAKKAGRKGSVERGADDRVFARRSEDARRAGLDPARVAAAAAAGRGLVHNPTNPYGSPAYNREQVLDFAYTRALTDAATERMHGGLLDYVADPSRVTTLTPDRTDGLDVVAVLTRARRQANNDNGLLFDPDNRAAVDRAVYRAVKDIQLETDGMLVEGLKEFAGPDSQTRNTYIARAAADGINPVQFLENLFQLGHSDPEARRLARAGDMKGAADRMAEVTYAYIKSRHDANPPPPGTPSPSDQPAYAPQPAGMDNDVYAMSLRHGIDPAHVQDLVMRRRRVHPAASYDYWFALQDAVNLKEDAAKSRERGINPQ